MNPSRSLMWILYSASLILGLMTTSCNDTVSITGLMHFKLVDPYAQMTPDLIQALHQDRRNRDEYDQILRYSDKLKQYGIDDKWRILLTTRKNRKPDSLFVNKSTFEKCWEVSPWILMEQGVTIQVKAKAIRHKAGIYEAIGDVEILTVPGKPDIQK